MTRQAVFGIFQFGMKQALSVLKKILGKDLTRKIRPLGHGSKALLAAQLNGYPGRELIKVGITGTKGKTTTSVLTGRLMNLAGLKTGYVTTSVIYTGKGEEFLNPYKMTTIDSFSLQKYLLKMLENDCKYVVLEMSSQGLEQNRHLGLGQFDAGVFLNLFPEHIEAHGSFENYRRCKGILFQNLKSNGGFICTNEEEQLEHAKFYTDVITKYVKPNETFQITVRKETDYQIQEKVNSIYKYLVVNNQVYKTNFQSDFDINNLVFAIKITQIYNPEIYNNLQTYLDHIKPIPGRMEFVVRNGQIVFEGSEKSEKKPKTTKLTNTSILVDYAHEPESLKLLLKTLNHWKKKGYCDQIIHILSSDGAGRDDWKKPIMGDLSLELADISLLTTDNYDEGDNPLDIIDLLGKNYPENLKNKKYFSETDRRKTFLKALEIAKTKKPQKTLIVSTGVGSEQGLTQPGGKIEWDERKVWIEMFNNF